MNVMIVEAQRMMRTMLVRLCAQELGHAVSADIGTGAELPGALRERSPDLLILAIELPDADGLEILSGLRSVLGRPAKVLLLASNCTHRMTHRVARACVHGLVDKSTDSIDALRTAITAVENGQSYFSQTYWHLLGDRQRQSVSYDKLLTEQEMRVFEMLSRLIDDKDIAASLHISMRTLEGYRLRIMDKLEVDDRVALLRYARDMGLLSTSASPFNQPNRGKTGASGRAAG